MSAYLDPFNADANWIKAGAWVDSTKSVASGSMTMTVGAGGAGSSAWKKDGLEGWNCSITVRAGASITGIPQIHLRESSATNYLVVYLNHSDATLNIGKVVAGVYTSLGSIASSIGPTGTYTFTGKVFGNCLYGAIKTADGLENVFKQLIYIGADISAFTGTSHGIGLTTGTQKYDWVDMRILDRLTNVVCVGDSNVGTDNRLFWPNQMMKRRFNEGFISINQGTGGYSTQDIYDERLTRIAPYVIQGADNVVSIATGNNDFAREDKTAAEAYAVQQTLMTYCKSLGYRCELATLIPFPYAGDPLTFVTDLNTLIRAGASVDGFTLCEIHNAFGATNGQYGVSPSTLVNADQIHYSTGTGHPLAAKTHLLTLARNDRYPVT